MALQERMVQVELQVRQEQVVVQELQESDLIMLDIFNSQLHTM
jgi:hypothetical protein